MKSLVSFALMSLIFSSCYSMEKGYFDRSNPYAILAVDDDNDGDESVDSVDSVAAVVDQPFTVAAPVDLRPLTLFDAIQGDSANALACLRDAFASGYDVNVQSREGKNTILHKALMLPSLECAYYILCEKWMVIDTSLKNRKNQTVLDLAYQRLADCTISVKLGTDVRGRFYSVVRDGMNVFKDQPHYYDIQQKSIACGMESVEMYTFGYGRNTYCFDANPLRSVVLVSRTLKQVFQVKGVWRGWVDLVYKLQHRGRVRILIDIIETLGGDEIGFAHFLFK